MPSYLTQKLVNIKENLLNLKNLLLILLNQKMKKNLMISVVKEEDFQMLLKLLVMLQKKVKLQKLLDTAASRSPPRQGDRREKASDTLAAQR